MRRYQMVGLLLLTLVVMVVVLVLAACSASSDPTYLTEEIPPCTPLEGYDIDPCEPETGITYGGEREVGDKPWGLRHFLYHGRFANHIILRGTYLPDTVRCEAKNDKREPLFTKNGRLPGMRVSCYADIRVNGYFLGSGPTTMTVVALRFQWPPREDEAERKLWRLDFERALLEGGSVSRITVSDGGIIGREKVLFLGPSTDYDVEVWQVNRAWDLERQDDGTVKVLHQDHDVWMYRDADTYRDRLTWTMAEFTAAAVAADAVRRADFDGRIGPDEDHPSVVTDVRNLRDFHVELGNVTHDEGPPGPPPPVPAR